MKKIYSLVLVLLPLLIYYDFPFTSIGISTSLSIFLLIIALIQNFKAKKHLDIELLVVFAYALISSFILIALGGRITFISLIYVLANILTAAFISGGIKSLIDIKFLLSSYKKICLIIISFFFLQHLICLLTGRVLFGICPFLPVSDSYTGINVGLLDTPRNYGYSMRLLSSLFSEPSHLAVYLLPMFVLALEEKDKPRIIVLIIVSTVIIMTLSGNGILTLAIFIVAYTALCKKIKVRKRVLYLLSMSIVFVFAFLLLNRLPIFSDLFANLFSNSFNKVAKADYRIYRGFYIFGTLPTENKIFGIGFQQITPYLTENNISTPFDFTGVTNLEYSNFIAQYMIYFGFIGLLPLLIFVVKLFKNGTYYSNAFLISIIALWFSSSMLFDVMWIYFIGFVFIFNYMKEGKQYAFERTKAFNYRRNEVYST